MKNHSDSIIEIITKIERLFEAAIIASNKATAKSFLRHIRSLEVSLNLTPYQRIVFNEFLAYAENASGQVKEKEHWKAAAEQSLYKLTSGFR
ncbi:hypothetical protein GCM10010912_59600 [Paenibacillus albidus]|uniref:Uncharacterized protein n=1 Tax=Paenibacillus albidus TaxID=2041023 RepID=A0A917D4C5_9BACL|nr:hypothetical protein [Paenibacillus albidus]GGG07032.1 hypothetical protein GCM10010912_59600 [Paenibacillus albidus]